MADRPRDFPALALPAALGTVAFGTMAVVDRATGTLRADSTPMTIGLYLVAFAAYLGAVIVVERGGEGCSWRLLWAAPIVFRLLLLTTDPTLSDDVYRYLWDGHVFSHGVNPYSYAISAPELNALSIPVRELANNPELSSPYLPTTQLLFAGLSLIAPSDPLIMQIVMVCFDVAAALLLGRLLRAVGLPSGRVVLYLWNPLVIVEAAHGAHFDSMMTFLMVGAVLAAVNPIGTTTTTTRRRSLGRLVLSPLLLALGVLTRPIPLLLAPVLWWRWTLAQRCIFAATLLVGVIPFGFGAGGWGLLGPSTGTGLFGSARIYSADFRFNAVPAAWLEQLVGGSGPYSVLVVAVTAVVALAVLGATRGTFGPVQAAPGGPTPVELRRIVRLSIIPLAVYVVLTPVLHPWYLVSVVAFGLFLAPGAGESDRRWLLLAPGLYLTAAIPFSYLTYVNPEAFRELVWVRRLQWYPVLFAVGVGPLLLGERIRWAQRRTRMG